MKTYVVKLALPSSRVGDILGLLERDIADVTIAIRDDAPIQRQMNGVGPALLPHYTGERPGLKKTILEALAKGPQDRKVLRQLVEANGYKETSLNTALQHLKNNKKIKLIRITNGTVGNKWQLVGGK